jgi:hypothetical protein
MIFASDTMHTVGEMGRGVTDIESNRHPEQPYYVQRTATREEWECEVLSGGGVIVDPDRVYPFYYEVSID